MAKQRQLLELVAESVPRCVGRDVEQRRSDVMKMDAQLMEATSERALRAQAARQPVDIDIARLETRAEAERRDSRRLGLAYPYF